jgi:hypothetical protein
MDRDELIDLAPLDAFALLDDYEAALFTRSFHHAPASVQAEVRDLQAQFAEDPAFLSKEEPRTLLRQKVLIRIQEEIEESEAELQPLAQIGQQVAGHGAGHQMIHAARTELDVSGVPSSDDAMRELISEIRARAAVGMRDRATTYWRAAAFFLAAGLIVSLYFLGQTMRHAETIARLAQNQLINAKLTEVAPDLIDFAYRESVVRGLASTDSSVNGTATLCIDAEHNRALVLAFGLNGALSGTKKGEFTLRAVDDKGNATVITKFTTNDPIFGKVADSLPLDIRTCKLELLDGDGRVILRTA